MCFSVKIHELKFYFPEGAEKVYAVEASKDMASNSLLHFSSEVSFEGYDFR